MARPAHDYARVDKHVPVTRRAETTNPYSPVTILIALVATLGILLYAQFLLNPANRGDWLPYVLVIVAESVLVAHALLAMWTVLSSGHDPRGFAFHHAQDRAYDIGESSATARSRTRAVADVPAGAAGHRRRLHHRPTARTSTRSGAPSPRRSRCRASTTPGCSTTAGPTRSATSPPSWAARYVRRLIEQRRQGRQHQPRAVDHQGRLLRHLRRRLRAAAGFPARDRAVLRRPTTSRSCRRRRPTATCTHLISRGAGYMQSVFYRVHPAGPEPVQRGVLRGHQRDLPRAAIERSAACTPTPSPRTCGPR